MIAFDETFTEDCLLKQTTLGDDLSSQNVLLIRRLRPARRSVTLSVTSNDRIVQEVFEEGEAPKQAQPIHRIRANLSVKI
ncbi:hypothetical protein INS49_014379 [Diaporthe citri]|uniref:uncharacterized protein n=1 Tax=Diaporthe citri TaxID=83186 RepID=UPI001C8192C3|nr:uncharacterized protein INS49_014379 [Diaporthe citri]KAG6358495.1 hypothetical protein INS49_014379 [Diaporthe citri]